MALNQSTTPERRMIRTWQNLLDEYKVQNVLLEVDNDYEFINGLRHQTKWAIVSEDDDTVLFTRRDMAQEM